MQDFIHCLPAGAGDYDFGACLKATNAYLPVTTSTGVKLSEDAAWKLIEGLVSCGIPLDALGIDRGRRLFADPSFVMLHDKQVLYKKAGFFYLTTLIIPPLPR